MNNLEMKQESFCRFTRLRGTVKTTEFMGILMDCYEAAQVAKAPEEVEPVIEQEPQEVKVKRTIRSTVNKGTK